MSGNGSADGMVAPSHAAAAGGARSAARRHSAAGKMAVRAVPSSGSRNVRAGRGGAAALFAEDIKLPRLPLRGHVGDDVGTKAGRAAHEMGGGDDGGVSDADVLAVLKVLPPFPELNVAACAPHDPRRFVTAYRAHCERLLRSTRDADPDGVRVDLPSTHITHRDRPCPCAPCPDELSTVRTALQRMLTLHMCLCVSLSVFRSWRQLRPFGGSKQRGSFSFWTWTPCWHTSATAMSFFTAYVAPVTLYAPEKCSVYAQAGLVIMVFFVYESGDGRSHTHALTRSLSF
jgi:hypothetical protein